ncbi:hypothetical protein O3G_MSEX009284 [Manduca sexta]|uniref:Uncharacterized protein n=1 Tax=Manduca sexta TaxID=7130 RepID=A0A922CRC6_MANSE|nr:hypothetical protein O3G_MSEX009284 [Manduca sexta]
MMSTKWILLFVVLALLGVSEAYCCGSGCCGNGCGCGCVSPCGPVGPFPPSGNSADRILPLLLVLLAQ